MTGKDFIESVQDHSDESIEWLIGREIFKGNINIKNIMDSYFAYVNKMKSEYENDLEVALRCMYFNNIGSDNEKDTEKKFIEKYEKKFGY